MPLRVQNARQLVRRVFTNNARSFIAEKPWEITLAIIKPDACVHPLVRKRIHGMILENNMFFVKSKSCTLNIEEAKAFYQNHKEKFFYNRLVTFMSSGPILVHVLTGDEIIQRWRNLMGPTKSFRAQLDEPNSIRGMFGLTDTRNATHGSDSLSSAIQETNFFFPEFNFEVWRKEFEPLFRSNCVLYDENMMQHEVKNKLNENSNV